MRLAENNRADAKLELPSESLLSQVPWAHLNAGYGIETIRNKKACKFRPLLLAPGVYLRRMRGFFSRCQDGPSSKKKAWHGISLPFLPNTVKTVPQCAVATPDLFAKALLASFLPYLLY